MAVGDRLGSIWRSIERYMAHPDPLVAACNWIALVVASNQPFYPLYVQATAGTGGLAAMLTFLSTPFFALAPLVARRNDRLGRAMLPLAGLGNGLLALALFGEGSGIPLFLAPVIVIAGLAFRPSERRWSLPIIGATSLAYFAGPRIFPVPLVALDEASRAALFGVNAFSVGCLLALVGLTFAGAMTSAPAKPAG